MLSHMGSGRSVHVLATVEGPASGSTAQLGRPFFHTPQSMTHRLSKLWQQHTPSSTYTHTHVCSKSSHTHTPSHTIFHRTPSFTHNFHIQLSNCSILHHLLCLCLLSLRATSSVLHLTRPFLHKFFARNIVTNHLSHTSLSHTIFHTHTQL